MEYIGLTISVYALLLFIFIISMILKIGRSQNNFYKNDFSNKKEENTDYYSNHLYYLELDNCQNPQTYKDKITEDIPVDNSLISSENLHDETTDPLYCHLPHNIYHSSCADDDYTYDNYWDDYDDTFWDDYLMYNWDDNNDT